MSTSSTDRGARNRILGGIAIGFVVLCLLILTDSPVLSKFENYGIDWMLRMNVGTASTERAGFVLLDIDEASYRMWGEPWITPRDKLLELIRFAEQGEAEILIVDIDLSQHIGAEGPLYRHLEGYLQPSRNLPHVLFSTSIRYPALDDDPDRPMKRESLLDPLVAGSPRLHWASPIFVKDSDQVIRRWQLLARLDGTAEVLPSHQFLAAGLLLDAERIPDLLSELSKEEDTNVARLGELELNLSDKNIPQRIHYAIPWRAGAGRAPTGVRGSAGATIIPAHRITDTTMEIDSSTLAGKVVVIGSSHRESGDVHRTPVGMMPGSLIIVNAVHSLLSVGQVHPPAWWLRVLIGLIPLVIMSVALEKVKLLILNKFLTWGLILLLVPASFVFFHYGVWMDFFLPMIIVDLVAKLRRARELKVLAVRGVKSVKRKAKAMTGND